MRLIASLAMAVFPMLATVHAAENYPERSITMIVPYPAGGSTDATARLVASRLGEKLKQTVVVDNRAGAGGNIGAGAAAQAGNDGYTILMITSGHVANRSLYKSLSYDLFKSFEPVSRISFIPNVLVVNENFPADSLQAFVDHARNTNVAPTYGSGGIGNSSHLAGVLFSSHSKVEMTHVPYKGGGPAMMDLLGGQIDASFSPIIEVIPHIRAGKLKPLGITTKERSAVLPDVPAIDEMFSGFDIALWNGLLVPAGVDPAIRDRLSTAVQEILNEPGVAEQLEKDGSKVSSTRPAEFTAFMQDEDKKWARIIQDSGAEAQ